MVEGMVSKAAWHWSNNSSLLNNSLGEQDLTPFYVGLPSVWGSVDSDHMFSPCFVGELLNWGP